MTWYTLNPDADKKQVDGNNITSSSTNYNGGVAAGIGNAPADSALTGYVRLGKETTVHGSQVIYKKNVFSAYKGAGGLAFGGIGNDGNGYIKITIPNSYQVGDIITITGSTPSEATQDTARITEATSGYFVIDQAYTQIWADEVGKQIEWVFPDPSAPIQGPVVRHYTVRGYAFDIAQGNLVNTNYSMTGYGADYGTRRSIHKVERSHTYRVATAIRNGEWNIFTGKWGDGNFEDLPTDGTDHLTWGTDEAATPTKAKPGELVYRHSGMPDATYGPIQSDYPPKTN